MKNIGSKLSNRTKVIGGMTILLGLGTIVSIVKDSKEIKELEADENVIEAAAEFVEEIDDGVSDVVETLDF